MGAECSGAKDKKKSDAEECDDAASELDDDSVAQDDTDLLRDECPVCLENNILASGGFDCNHQLCRTCTEKLEQCPMCRAHQQELRCNRCGQTSHTTKTCCALRHTNGEHISDSRTVRILTRRSQKAHNKAEAAEEMVDERAAWPTHIRYQHEQLEKRMTREAEARAWEEHREKRRSNSQEGNVEQEAPGVERATETRLAFIPYAPNMLTNTQRAKLSDITEIRQHYNIENTYRLGVN